MVMHWTQLLVNQNIVLVQMTDVILAPYKYLQN